jgi:hypothetical protein
MHVYGTRKNQTSFEVFEFLRKNDRLASLLPGATRMARLQNDCAAILPAMFSDCGVISHQEGALVLAVPSSALAARLKQQVLKLQHALQQRGWQVESVKLNVQVTRPVPEREQMRTLELPPTAVDAFDALGDTLPQTAQNAGLIAALKSLAAKRRQG